MKKRTLKAKIRKEKRKRKKAADILNPASISRQDNSDLIDLTDFVVAAGAIGVYYFCLLNLCSTVSRVSGVGMAAVAGFLDKTMLVDVPIITGTVAGSISFFARKVICKSNPPQQQEAKRYVR